MCFKSYVFYSVTNNTCCIDGSKLSSPDACLPVIPHFRDRLNLHFDPIMIIATQVGLTSILYFSSEPSRGCSILEPNL